MAKAKKYRIKPREPERVVSKLMPEPGRMNWLTLYDVVGRLTPRTERMHDELHLEFRRVTGFLLTTVESGIHRFRCDIESHCIRTTMLSPFEEYKQRVTNPDLNFYPQ